VTSFKLLKTGASDERALPGVVCVRCGYALKGLGLKSVCPECALAVERSLPGGVLRDIGVVELAAVRGHLGGWCAMLVVLGLFYAGTGVACPALGLSSSQLAWLPAQRVATAGMMAVAACLWLPIMALRRHTEHPRLRRAAVVAEGALWLGAIAAAAAPYLLMAGDGSNQGLARDVVLYAGAALTPLSHLLLWVFFKCGTRFTQGLTHADNSEAGRHGAAGALAVLGLLAAIVGDLIAIRGVRLWFIWLGADQRELVIMSYGAAVVSGALIAAACVVWTGACARIERRIDRYVDAVNAAALRRQLAGAE
jgi:hypothetical protein